MSVFTDLKTAFDVNWTTILVGWTGLGLLSPWPDRWVEFPPLLSAGEIAAFADERLALSSDQSEQDLTMKLLSFNLPTERREAIRDVLKLLSDLEGNSQAVELRKWRLVLLQQALEKLPQDAVYGLIALSEFWQSFGFPSDSPHEIQGRGNTLTPDDYYQQDNLNRLLARHHKWIEQERAAIKKEAGKSGDARGAFR